jgi:protein-S-isoprenylcysteine O-methyltransferase Ste14
LIQYAWRGWILGALFVVLAIARFRSHAPLVPAGLILVAFGAAFRLYAGRYMPGHSNFLRLSGETLALQGPYLFGRHPLYLSNLATIAGLILFANCLPWWGAALLMAMAWAHHEILARAEERYLVSAWGEAYLSYMRVTPRWLGFPRGGTFGKREPANGTAAPGVQDGPGNAEPGAARASAPALTWARQGANLGKTAGCVLFLWLLAVLRP